MCIRDSLDGVVLLEADINTIAIRIRERDGREADMDHTAEFLSVERTQAQMVCVELGIPLRILNAPSPSVFTESVQAAFLGSGG